MDNENTSVGSSVAESVAEVPSELTPEQVAAQILREKLEQFALANGMPREAVLSAEKNAWVHRDTGVRYRNDGELHAKHGPSKSAELSENRQLIRNIQNTLLMEEDKVLRACFEKDEVPPRELVDSYEFELARRERVQPWFQDLVPDNAGSAFTVTFADGSMHEGIIRRVEGKKGRHGGVIVHYDTNDDLGLKISWRDRTILEAPKFTNRVGGSKTPKNPRGPRGDSSEVEARASLDAVAKCNEIVALEKRVKNGKIDDAGRARLADLRAWREKLLASMPS